MGKVASSEVFAASALPGTHGHGWRCGEKDRLTTLGVNIFNSLHLYSQPNLQAKNANQLLSWYLLTTGPIIARLKTDYPNRGRHGHFQ